jgi:hypothetical protein
MFVSKCHAYAWCPCTASAPTPWGGAGQTWIPAPGALPHPLQQARQLTPAQERERQEQEELDAALKVCHMHSAALHRCRICIACSPACVNVLRLWLQRRCDV